MASKIFDSIDLAMKYLEKNVEYSIKIVANRIKTLIKDYVYKNLYLKNAPNKYQRTGQLLESLDISVLSKNGNTYEVEVFFNPDYIDMIDVDGFWNAHKSVYGYESWHGKSINELIPWFISNGTNGSVYDREGIYPMENIVEILEKTNEHLKIIVKILKSNGYDVKIV